MTRPAFDDHRPEGAFEVTLKAMGAKGDAIGGEADLPVFVTFALPGERVIAVPKRETNEAIWADTWQVTSPSPERVTPTCRHFGACGGCKLQHWQESAYRRWKVNLVLDALQRRGLSPPAEFETSFVRQGSRRRVELAAIGHQVSATLGFHAVASAHVIDVVECPIMVPELAKLLPSLRLALGGCLGSGTACDILLTASETGPDMLITSEQLPSDAQRKALIDFARLEGLARISWRASGREPDILFQDDVPRVSFDGVSVDLPIPSFLQPTLDGEKLLRSGVARLLGKPRRVAELYCGLGTFTFALAKRAHVMAFDGAKSAVEALRKAARGAGLQQRIECAVRDLEQSPLSLAELRRLSAVVMDPPRAGAKRQSRTLAKSDVPMIIYVSCNPSSFARDARTLAEGGYKLASLTIVDQFRWSHHVELLAQFRK